MGDIYLLDSSAMEVLNVAETVYNDLIDGLVDLRDRGCLLYSEAVKDERRAFAKQERITVWAVSGWRSIASRSSFEFATIQQILNVFASCGTRSIMDLDNENVEDQQALTTIGLAYQLRQSNNVVVVSDEEFTMENRCTVGEACEVLQIVHTSVAGFLETAGLREGATL